MIWISMRRYGVEDTAMRHHWRHAKPVWNLFMSPLIAKRKTTFRIFRTNGYAVIRNPAELSRQLPILYVNLTRR